MSDRPLAIAVIAGVMLATLRGDAEELAVDFRRCTWLDEAELAKLSKLELGTEDTAGLSLDYACGGNDVTIGIANEKMGIRVERLITGACCDDADPERTLALLSVGLLQAARTLLGASSQKPGEPMGTVVLPAIPAKGEALPVAPAPPAYLPGDPVARTANNAVVATPPNAVTPWTPTYPPAPMMVETPSDDEDDDDRIHQLGLTARTRFHNLEDATTTYGVGAHYRAWPWPRFALGAAFDAGFGSVAREGGEVDVRLLSLSALVGTRFATWGPLSLLAELRGGATIVTVEGDAVAGFIGDAVTGGTGHVVFALLPALRSDYAELSLPIEIGGLFRAPRGVVDDGTRVQVDGFWAGGGIAFSLGWGEREREPALGRMR